MRASEMFTLNARLPQNEYNSKEICHKMTCIALLNRFRNNESRRTPWEAVYAFRQGRKLIKPTFQGRVYNFLERPREWKSILYHTAVYTAILGSLFLSVLATVAENKSSYSRIVYVVEIILVTVFTIEYIARFWSAGCRSKYLGIWGRFKFATKPICIIDLIIIISSFIVIFFGSDGHTFGVKAVRGVRFLQILRMLHVDREGGCWRLLGSVIMEHRQEMFTALYIGFLGLVFSSYFMFLVEKDVFINNMPSTAFATYADALWWGVVTMMTIGYGDKVPLTWTGRLLACISALFTVSFFALPAGILGSGFALKVQQQQRQKHFSRQIPVAATLIQTLWRCYAADKNYSSVATWKIHMKNPSNSTNKYNKTIAALRRRKPKYRSDTEKSDQNDKSYGEIAVTLEAPRTGLHQSRSVPDMMISMHDDLLKKDGSTVKLQSIMNGNEDYQNDSVCEDGIYGNSTCYTQLSETHKNAIRAIRKIKYFVAKRKFQQARKPYDVGDVIEQYSQGQISMNVRLKELHRRLDQMLGKSGTHLSGKNGKPITLGEKLQQMDQQIQMMDRKIDNISYSIHAILREIQKTPRIETSTCS
ncbi:potassium voltage-gated channel subfamily KQT member 1 [Caerostris darwini]|uniref:IKs producing slow voltage-gated potassium channel subunit alpha KvLQT1 n=1 Tax=Caerostris darwini TaxID=1538125 RepID=A0AAV4R305_9ARAC|nr:potassium voltage-gated channel subfamily KQT member 1 [Caerostris darwini]